MQQSKIWNHSGNTYYPADISSTVPKLPNGVYHIGCDPMSGAYWLTKVSDSFNFNFKVYGLESDLIRRITTYYNSSIGNLGVLLNGQKGTGKTVTSKLLANALENPILVVQSNTPGLVGFLNSVEQDITILIDEYEKVFSNKDSHGGEDSTLLSIMDGVIESSYRRTFILTTNELYLNDNLLDRPGRIRYKKLYKDLDLATILEILDDILEYPEHKEAILDFCKTLELITVDIVKAIVREVNLFNEAPEKCCHILNAKIKASRYNLVIKGSKDLPPIASGWNIGDMRSVVKEYAKQKPKQYLHWDHPVEDQYMWFVKKIEGKDEYVFECNLTDDEGEKTGEKETYTLAFEEVKYVHSSFVC